MKSRQPRVTVHVDVGMDGTKKVKKQIAPRKATLPVRPLSIIRPSPTGDTAIVLQAAGLNYIEASGGSLASNGAYPSLVYAKAFPNANVSPLDAANWEPPDDGSAVSRTPNPDGSWSFLAGVTPPGPVPGATFDNIPGNTVNSTLLVWYEYDYEDGWDVEYTVESSNFHGFIAGSGVGVLQAPLAVAPAHRSAAKLVATFTGALSALGPVKLAWNGVSWVGTSTHGGGAMLMLCCQDETYQLLATGPAVSFVVAGAPTSLRPFSWTATGAAIGHAHGAFKVTITE